MSRTALVWIAALSLGACGGERGPTGTRGPTGWNVLLVSIDTLRADHLSSYGATNLRTPAMDELASQGVLFENAVSVAPTTLPAHASLFTATTPPGHGVRDNVGFYLPRGAETLATRLSSAGYETAAFVGAFVLDGRFGLAQGFDLYDDELGDAAEGLAGGLVAQRDGALVLESVLGWLGTRKREGPFFAFVHFYDPHTPYEPKGGAPLGADDPSRYRGEVAYVDSLVGRLLDRLEEEGLTENTVILLTSDHGESLGEHGEKTHGYFVYESTLRIPLLLCYPGGPRGERVSQLVRLTDVAPTLLDLLGLPPLEGAEGESLLPLVEGGGPERSAYAESFVPRLHYGWSELRSFRRGDAKLILAPKPELYDLASDPNETRNRIEEDPSLARSLEEELQNLIAQESAEVEGADLDEESRKKLEALGYVEGSPRDADAERADPKDWLDVYLLVNDPAFESIDPEDERAMEDAIRRLQEVLEKDASVPRVYVLLGDLFLSAGRVEEAERTFRKLVELEPDGFSGHFGLGVARGLSGQHEAAVESLERALALEPRNTKAHFRLADVESSRGNFDAAEAWLRRALQIQEDPTLTVRLGEVLLEAGKLQEARSVFASLAREGEQDARAAYNLGQVLLLEGKSEAALAELVRSRSLDPFDPDVHQALGNAHAGAGRLEEAVASYEEAIRLSPCFAQAHGNLGLAYAQLARFEDAVRSLEKAVSCDPGYAVAYKNLAAIRLDAGDVSGAVAAMRKAVEASPEDEELARTLRELIAYERSR